MEEQGDPIELDAPCGIRLCDVTYAYDKEDGNVIDNLNF